MTYKNKISGWIAKPHEGGGYIIAEHEKASQWTGVPEEMITKSADWEEVKELDSATQFYLNRTVSPYSRGGVDITDEDKETIALLRKYAALATHVLRSENEELRSSLQNLESYVNQSADKKWTDNDMCDFGSHCVLVWRSRSVINYEGELKAFGHEIGAVRPTYRQLFVRITNGRPLCWYVDKVGQTFQVELAANQGGYIDVKNSLPIFLQDCEVVPNPTAQ